MNLSEEKPSENKESKSKEMMRTNNKLSGQLFEGEAAHIMQQVPVSDRRETYQAIEN
jgi:hypothetical protein